MNLGEIWAECGRLLNDPNNERWIQSTLTFRANQAATEVESYTHAVKRKTTYTPTAEVAYFIVNSDVLDIYMVRITRPSGKKERLEGITREELDVRFPDWENWDSGEPQFYWFDGTGDRTNAQINLVPKPNAASAITDCVESWEIRAPDTLSDSTHVPFDASAQMAPYVFSIVHWVVAQCWMDDATPEALAKARFHKSGMLERPGEFEKQILRIRKDFDSPTDVPLRIMYQVQGGRLRRGGHPSKSNPLNL